MNDEFLIVAELPEPWRSRIAGWRRRYDRWSNSWLPPHVTIIRPLKHWPTALRAQAGDLHYPFTVTFQGWSIFRRPNANVIWLDPGQREPARVRRAIDSDFPDLAMSTAEQSITERSRPYHITVVNRIPDDTLEAVRRTLAGQDVAGRCTISCLTAYRRSGGQGQWERLP